MFILLCVVFWVCINGRSAGFAGVNSTSRYPPFVLVLNLTPEPFVLAGNNHLHSRSIVAKLISPSLPIISLKVNRGKNTLYHIIMVRRKPASPEAAARMSRTSNNSVAAGLDSNTQDQASDPTVSHLAHQLNAFNLITFRCKWTAPLMLLVGAVKEAPNGGGLTLKSSLLQSSAGLQRKTV